MSEEKILAVDFTQEEACLEILPRSPLVSSYHAQWQGLRLDVHQQPAHETPEHSPQQHVITVSLEQKVVRSERIIDGRFQHENIAKGDVAIIPAHTHHISRWQSEAKFLVLSMEPAFFTRMAIEAGDLQKIEVKPRFAAPDPLIQQIGLALQTELESDDRRSGIYIESLTTTLCIHLLKHYCVAGETILKDHNNKGLSHWKLRQAISYIHENLDQDLTLADISRVVGISMYYFSRQFKHSTGFAPHQYVMNCRIERAKKLLSSTNKTIEQICAQVGFQSQSHFTSVFRKLIGITPRAYREQVKI
ncbi:AraC family transcriptional regulator [Anabaena subtropica]|uniref:Helix-turn-helix transcriptional regulator n=1 Tax=Anabaena subtropica FACHB-260 TaxID=2692884 RepID=A0ABR8CTQ6_9NOST|nr:AraC family transcriptional regulator [Anabaena subtropica]MBD2346570.1 helix-turn-helix transcriptional regulator [Anabaena subtropica FACHB-260]